MKAGFYPHGSANGSSKLSITSPARTFCCHPENSSNALRTNAPRRILLPIDIAKCPLEVFPFVNEFTKDPGASVALLHVLSGPVEQGDSQKDRARAAEKQLEQLTRKFINPRLPSLVGVRAGLPSDAILAEAARSHVDLIVLASHEDAFFGRRPIRSRTVQAVLDAAPCNVTLLPVRTSFNCAQQWELVDEIVQALNYVGLLGPVPKCS